MKETKQAQKDYLKAKAKYNQAKIDYIQFLKHNNMWSDELEKKYNPKKINNPLIMDKFDEDFAVRYTRAKINKQKSSLFKVEEGKIKLNLKAGKNRYGDDKKKNYEFYVELNKTVEEICRVNKWTTKKQWEDKGLNLEKYIKLMVKAATEYSEILKYYKKQEFAERQAKHMGR